MDKVKDTLKLLLSTLILVLVMTFSSKNVNASETKVKKGDIITFGTYEQDNNLSNGSEPIEWIVLEVKNDKALLLSKFALDNKPYYTWDDLKNNVPDSSNINLEYPLVSISSWKDCSLRKWLNDDFYNNAFSKSEKKAIVSSSLKNVDTTKSEGTFKFEDTKDKVFLLSLNDIQNKDYGFANEEDLYCGATEYAVKQGVPSDANDPEDKYFKENWKWVDGKLACSWWLRSGMYYARIGGEASYIVTYYGIYGCGEMLGEVGSYGGVRPAMWISLNSSTLSGSSSSSLSKPQIAADVKNNSVSITISQNINADGYYIYVKKDNGKYKKVKTLKKNGSISRSVTLKNLESGTYSIRVKAYKKTEKKKKVSKYSNVVNAVINPQNSKSEPYERELMNVPRVIGLSVEDAEKLIKRTSPNFVILWDEDYSDDYVEGTIAVQYPESGATVWSDCTIRLTVSVGS